MTHLQGPPGAASPGRRGRRGRRALAIGALLAMVGVWGAAPSTAGVAADTTAPKMLSATADKSTLDISTSDASVTITAHVTDDLSGFSYAYLYYTNPSGTITKYDYLGTVVSGTSRDGFFSGSLTIPQYSETGLWKPSYAYAYDKVGNQRAYSGSALTALGLPSFTVSDTATTAPAAPTGVTATRGNGSATVSWTAPDNGGATITSYTVTASPGGATATQNGNPAGTNATVTGLANGTAYTFTVKATNAVGTGPASVPSDPATPATVPGAPRSVTAVATDGGATVDWLAPSSDGGDAVVAYTVTASPGGASTTVAGNPPATSASVTGLTNGTSYAFTVTATNSVGSGPSSAPSAPVTPTNTACTITGTNGVNIINGTPGDDVICALGGNDIIMASGGHDIILGGDGIDTVTYAAQPGPIVLDLGAGSAEKPGALLDTLTDVENVTGSSGADQLTGDDGNNVLDGGPGSDRIVGLGGNDTLRGSGDDDTILPGLGADGADGGTGANTLSYEDSPVFVRVDTGAGTAVSGAAINDSIASFSTVVGSSQDDFLTGGGADDVFLGGPGRDTLGGGGGKNTLFGEEGDDYFFSTGGTQVVDGGAGTDIMAYRNFPAAVTINLSTGLVSSSVGTDTLSDIENASGTRFADVLIGDSGPNALNGVDGNDQLVGKGGDDLLVGGTGLDTVSMAGSPGATYVNLTSNRSYGDGTDRLSEIENATGSNFADTLYGNASVNVLHGGGGNDSLYGVKGNDSLFGEGGLDYLSGGDGNDAIDGGPGNDTIDGGAGTDRCTQGPGSGRVTGCP